VVRAARTIHPFRGTVMTHGSAAEFIPAGTFVRRTEKESVFRVARGAADLTYGVSLTGAVTWGSISIVGPDDGPAQLRLGGYDVAEGQDLVPDESGFGVPASPGDRPAAKALAPATAGTLVSVSVYRVQA
jgi:hypothetical protein